MLFPTYSLIVQFRILIKNKRTEAHIPSFSAEAFAQTDKEAGTQIFPLMHIGFF
jgi:hypothetical protein